ncbi:hypothetical protein L228DRAFT_258277 [Xylona heveae TC161]|uniref:Large ribosomal subunit protein mL67 n=1 Tax=Xylona heveae (strain CBS 132557 / TC161) TaxID=1328760 RepID=A0A165K2T5_XYLHT|nr:hypothetical protein L228DRAFT_258277 [Xylona heveae TC161]KZF26922.1 hypothetical protein L228DRAFT_258277 [Xylona heveae TC161]
MVNVSKTAADHGRHIFVYNNLRTNQVIYSLTRAIQNNAALRQIPFVGKKTVPAAIRKDTWQPMSILSFPSSDQGLVAYQKLREFRKLHELQWPEDKMRNPDNPSQLMTKKQRAKALMNQKANSIADMAAVLHWQEKIATIAREEEEVAQAKRAEKEQAAAARKQESSAGQVVDQIESTDEATQAEEVVKAERGDAQSGPPGTAVEAGQAGSAAESPRPVPKRGVGKQLLKQEKQRQIVAQGVDGVAIHWANILDAEYAQSWPLAVIHDIMPRSRHIAPDPKTLPSLRELQE